MSEDLAFKKARLHWDEVFHLADGLEVNAADVVRLLDDNLTDERRARLHDVVAKRSLELVPVLENIHDRGNVSAAMRSCEAFGFLQMYLVDRPGAKFKAANRVTKGAEKWLDVRTFDQPGDAVDDLHARGYQVWATDLDTQDSIDTLDWSKPLAIVLGNEKDGVSAEMLAKVDGRFRIPMLGFSQSFNISVAAALIFYRAYLETRTRPSRLTDGQRQQILANYYLRCFDNPAAILRAKISGSRG